MGAFPLEHLPSSPESQSARDQDVSLKTEVERLREEVRSIKSEKVGFWKKVATALGILGGLFAIPKAAQTAYDTLVRRPKTEITAHDMAVFFNPNRAVFVARVPISVANRGNAIETLKDAEAIVDYVPGNGINDKSKGEEIRVGQGAFIFSGKGSLDELALPPESQITLPIDLPKDDPRTLYCSIEVDRDFLARPGQSSLEIGIVGTGGKRYPVKLCFDLNALQISELKTRHSATGKRWYASSCTQTVN